MSKANKFWFKHDHNARHDRKMAALAKDYKSVGIGIFWTTVEMMHEEGGKLDFDEMTFSAIAKDVNEPTDVVSEIINKCVSNYRLFLLNDNILISNRVDKNLKERSASREQRVSAGKVSAELRKKATTVERPLSDRITPVERPLNDSSTEERRGDKRGLNTEDNLTKVVKTVDEELLDVNKVSSGSIKKLHTGIQEIFCSIHPKSKILISNDYWCGEIARLISEWNDWDVGSVYNGKMDSALAEWKEAISIAQNDKYLFSRTIKDFAQPNDFERLFSLLNFDKNGTNKQPSFQAGRDIPTDKP